MTRFSIIVSGVLVLLVVSSISGRTSAPGAEQSRMKNIKVLTGMSDADVTQAMQEWTKALGTKCSFCHELGDYASDDNDKKQIARRMALMVKTINKDFLKGDRKASCVLCHRGNTTPEATSN